MSSDFLYGYKDSDHFYIWFMQLLVGAFMVSVTVKRTPKMAIIF